VVGVVGVDEVVVWEWEGIWVVGVGCWAEEAVWGEVAWFVVWGGEVCWAAGDGCWMTVMFGEEVGGDVV
jgi:hypothetical protein